MDDPSDLFDLPEFGAQQELLSLSPVAREFDSDVELPVARVLPDIQVPHMDRLFDYEIPAKMANAEVGARVRVHIGSHEVDGFIVERSNTTAHRLRPLKRLVSPIRVLTPEVLKLCRAVARRQASPVASAVRLAVPQRHARAEREFFEMPAPEAKEIRIPDAGAWDHYIGGSEFVAEFRVGKRPSGVVQLRGRDRARHLLPYLVAHVRSVGQSAIVVVPTPVMARALALEIAREIGEDVAVMVSEDDHATRYRTFLGIVTGRSRVVVGTRAAAWAPARDVGLVAIVDDQHSALQEKRAPYIHAREVLALRAQQTGCAFVSMDFGPSIELAQRVADGAAAWITPAPSTHRSGVAQILSANDFRTEGLELTRMPSAVFSVTRSGLEHGPVLFTVPQAGYIPLLACQNCRELARCPQCAGMLAITQPDSPPSCSRCALTVRDFRCPNCSSKRLRAVRIGSHRTAHEIGRAFRGVTIHLAGVGENRGQLDESARIVVATPGVAPMVPGGYAAGVVLDSGYLLRSTRLDSEVHFIRSIAHTAALVRARAGGGKLLVVGDVPNELINVLHTWDMAGWSERVLSERRTIGLPPATVWVEVKGTPDDVRDYLGVLRSVALGRGEEASQMPVDALFAGGAHDVIPGMAVLGPNPAGNEIVVYLRFPAEDREEKTSLIYEAVRTRSAARPESSLRLVVDPRV